MGGHEVLQQTAGGQPALAHTGPRLVRSNSQEAKSQEGAAVSAPVRDSPAPGGHLVPAVALLMEAIARDEQGDPDATELGDVLTISSDESDQMLFAALAHVALRLLGRQVRYSVIDARLISGVADLFDEVNEPAPVPGKSVWPEEPLTRSENRVLRYLPTHLSAQEIAAELNLSTNTVKTHLLHLYRKLGAHSRHEAVRRARAVGLIAASRRMP